jgi:hypothetical protein
VNRRKFLRMMTGGAAAAHACSGWSGDASPIRPLPNPRHTCSRAMRLLCVMGIAGIFVAGTGCGRRSESESATQRASMHSAELKVRVGAILPHGWHVLRVEDDPTPIYRPPGKGVLLVLGRPEEQQGPEFKPTGVNLYVMSPEYDDGGELADQDRQTWPAGRIYDGPDCRIYLWAVRNMPDWPTMDHDVIRAVTRVKD